MLELILSLLVALGIAAGAQGIATAAGHASPAGNAKATAAIQAIIDATPAELEQADPAAGKPDVTGLDRAMEVANEHAADGLARAAAASAAGKAKGVAASAARQGKGAAASAAGKAHAGAEAGNPPTTTPPVERARCRRAARRPPADPGSACRRSRAGEPALAARLAPSRRPSGHSGGACSSSARPTSGRRIGSATHVARCDTGSSSAS